MSHDNKDFGLIGEEETCKYLLRRGYQIIERNFRCKGGEIDIVAAEPESRTIVFIEVKTRRSRQYGTAALSITPKKQMHMVRSIGFYLHSHHQYKDWKKRVDVMEVYLGKGWSPDGSVSGSAELNLIKNIRLEGVERYAF